jgi:hypothetical protein
MEIILLYSRTVYIMKKEVFGVCKLIAPPRSPPKGEIFYCKPPSN